MRMRAVNRGILAALLAVAAFAAWGLTEAREFEEGRWPATWPKALEPYRAQARTHVIHHAYLGTTNQTAYEIEFASREEFEKAWPAILAVRDKGAPITLASPPAFHDVLTGMIDAGVRIWGPTSGTAYIGGQEVPLGPPWPDEARLPSGILPEYVTYSEGKWIPFDKSDREAFFTQQRWRARTEIELVVDGKIVDLNRIALPADTPIIDERKAVAGQTDCE